MNREQLENFGSIITIKGTSNCLGFLMFFDGRGCYCPSNGLVPVTKEEADQHNKALDTAMLDGLDKNCQVGQGGTFYWKSPPLKVTTFLGTLVSDRVTKNGASITFFRGGKTYRGREQRDAECFNFRRIA